MQQTRKQKEESIDKAIDMTFPASDAPAHGKLTTTEPPTRLVDRKAPVITKEQIEQARRYHNNRRHNR